MNNIMNKSLCLLFMFLANFSSASIIESNQVYNIKKSNSESGFKFLKSLEDKASQKYNFIMRNITFMPVLLLDDQVQIPPNIDKHLKDKLTQHILAIPSLFYSNQESILGLNFSQPESNFIIWESQNRKLLIDSLSGLQITESIELSNKYLDSHESGLNYILFPVLKQVNIYENRDAIPYTSLVSLIVNINIRIAFTLVSANNGIIQKKFVVTGHSGISRLLEMDDYFSSYNIDLLLNDAFNNLILDFKNDMNDDNDTILPVESGLDSTVRKAN